MKKWLLILFCVCLLTVYLAVGTAAVEIVDKGYCGGEGDGTNLTWTLNDEGTFTISGSGAMADYGNYSNRAPWYNNTSSIKTLIISDGVTSIGNNSFYYCRNLTSVSVPNSVTSIGNNAFWGSGLTRVTIPESAINIGKSAFSGSKLNNVTIPAHVMNIGDGAFSTCMDLISINVSSNNPNYKSVDGVLFSKDGKTLIACPSGITGCYVIPDNVRIIGNHAFHSCLLTDVIINNGTTSIGDYAFYNCEHLTNLEIPYGVENIGEHAFDTSGLISITIPNSISYIGAYPFQATNSLRDIFYGGSEAEWKKIINIRYLENIQYIGDDGWLDPTSIHFYDPAKELQSALRTNPTEYNNNLALIAANLSLKTYDDDANNPTSIENCLRYDFKFNDENHAKIYSNNYGGSLAFTVATRDYPGSDADKILVIVAQGSTNPYELLKDATALSKSSYRGYAVYDIVQDFYNAINEGLDHVLEYGKTYKVLVTGHSLGGAAADLVAASITDYGLPRYNSTCPKVFCYTFGAINAICSDSTVTAGYRNIHNVYNYLDTFSPIQFGGYLPTGMGRGFGKFGVMEPYVLDWRSDADKSKPAPVQIADHINHKMDKYVEAVRGGAVEASPYRSGRSAIVACPVDVDVFCEGTLVGRVKNGSVDKEVTTLDIQVEDDVKFVLYPDERYYELQFTAYDDGEMVFSIQDTSSGESKLFTNVSLSAGKEMFSETAGGISVPETQLLVMHESESVLAAVQADGTEVPVDKTALMVCEPVIVFDGETASVTAVIENFKPEAESCALCAALYCGGRMVDLQVLSDIAVPVNREIRKSFSLTCPKESGEMMVKLFYMAPDTFAPLAECAVLPLAQ